MTITLSATRIIDAHVHLDSLRFFDQKHSIFHSNDHDQVAVMLTKADENVREADMSELLDLADEQMENDVRGFFEESLGDRELIIVYEERIDSTAKNAEIDS